MPDPRTVLAAALGIGIGALFVAFPEVVIRTHAVGRLPHDRDGTYGETASAPDRWRLLVRALGVVSIAAGVYFGVTAFAGA